MDILLIIIIVAAACCVISFFYWFFKKKLKISKKSTKPPKPKKQKKQKQKQLEKKSLYEIKKFNLVLTEKFMYRKELLFWKYLNSILPHTFVAVPKVAMASLVSTDGDKNLYNEIASKTLDIVVFDEQTMRPILVVDVYDNSYNDDCLEEQDPKLYEIVTKLGLKVVKVLMQLNLNKEEIKRQIYQKLNIQIGEDE